MSTEKPEVIHARSRIAICRRIPLLLLYFFSPPIWQAVWNNFNLLVEGSSSIIFIMPKSCCRHISKLNLHPPQLWGTDVPFEASDATFWEGREEREGDDHASCRWDGFKASQSGWFSFHALVALVGTWLGMHGCGIWPHAMSVHRLPKIGVSSLRKGKHLWRNPHIGIFVHGKCSQFQQPLQSRAFKYWSPSGT